MKDLIIIAALGENNELGLNNKLIWHLPKDLKFFKENTIGKNIIMGYNTYKSLPGLLPKRIHLVLTHKNINNTDMLMTFDSIDKLFNYLSKIDEDVYVIGGAAVYKELMPYASKMLLTHIQNTHEADAYFPAFDLNDWDRIIIDNEEENNIKYKHYLYKRK